MLYERMAVDNWRIDQMAIAQEPCSSGTCGLEPAFTDCRVWIAVGAGEIYHGAHLLIRERLSVVSKAVDTGFEPERIDALLIATPRSIFSWSFDLHRGDELVAHIDMAWLREAADVFIGGQDYTFLRESILQGTFALKQGDEVLARAQKTSIFSRSFEVEIAGGGSTLRPVWIWGREFALYNGDLQVGRIYPQTWFRWTAVIDLPDGLTLPEQVFLYWLVLVMWRRQAKSNSG